MIEPRYRSERVTLYLADCLDVLPQLTGVDAVVTDPPWNGRDITNNGRDPDRLLADAVVAANPKRLAVQLGCDVDPRGLSLISMPFIRVCWLEYAMPGYKNRILNTGDIGYIFGEPPPRRDGYQLLPGKKTDTSNSKRTPKEDHPCARRLSHVTWLVSKFTALDDVVCDPFLGSGTTGLAALQLGRHFIGIEMREDYYQVAERRIRDAESQLLLPGVM